MIFKNMIVSIAVLSAVTVYGRPLPPMPTKPTGQDSPMQYDKSGLILNTDKVSDGYTLVATRGHTATYLIDNEGYVVHEWNHDKITAMCSYLLPNGNLLHAVKNSMDDIGNSIQELTWDGEVVWTYTTDQSVQRMHHDVERLPNGNTLVTVWEKKTRDEYIAAGRDPETVPDNVMWVCAIHEIRKTGKATGEVVWRWSAWDHLIQDFDETKANYGDPSKHPHRIDLNQVRAKKMKLADWLHINAVSYNPEWENELIVSAHALSEIWVVSRKSGELIYRWGNPQRYGKGGEADRKLFNQHDPHRIPKGLRGAGNILIFNNMMPVQGTSPYSSVLEIKPPVTDSGNWPSPGADGIFPPGEVVWEFTGAPDAMFFSGVVSNAQRLRNGGTLICCGYRGVIIELDTDGKRVWEFVNPIFGMASKIKKLEKWNNLPSPGLNQLFRAYKFTPDYPAFKGKDLSPKRLLESNEPPESAAQLSTP